MATSESDRENLESQDSETVRANDEATTTDSRSECTKSQEEDVIEQLREKCEKFKPAAKSKILGQLRMR